MTPDQRNRVHHGPFTTWQWAVLLSYGVSIVLAAAIGMLAHRADINARRGNTAICAEVAFLRASLAATERLIVTQPASSGNAVRRESAVRVRNLIRALEHEIPNCREALR